MKFFSIVVLDDASFLFVPFVTMKNIKKKVKSFCKMSVQRRKTLWLCNLFLYSVYIDAKWYYVLSLNQR